MKIVRAWWRWLMPSLIESGASWVGMSATTGRRIAEIDHIRQSVRDILTTPIGSRVMRREYGSLLPELIDQPLNGATLLRAYAATVMALTPRLSPQGILGEPRIEVRRVQFVVGDAGQLTVDIEAVRVDGPRAGRRADLSVQLRGAA